MPRFFLLRSTRNQSYLFIARQTCNLYAFDEQSRFYVNIGGRYFDREKWEAPKIQEPRRLHGQLIEPKMNLYRRGSFILRLHIWTSVTTVYKLIRKLIDRSIMCPGNRVTFEIIPFSVLLNCPMGQRKKKGEKRTNNIEREERKIMENTIKGENSGQWRSSADTNSHRG